MNNIEERNKKLEELAKGIYGECLLDYLKEKKIELKSIDEIKSFEELVGRQEAVKMIDKVFYFFSELRDRKEPRPRNQYK